MPMEKIVTAAEQQMKRSIEFLKGEYRGVRTGRASTGLVDGLKVTVEGIEKELVGDTAARIRSYYPAEPYKGKGIKYVDEQIRRKQGKTVA